MILKIYLTLKLIKHNVKWISHRNHWHAYFSSLKSIFWKKSKLYKIIAKEIYLGAEHDYIEKVINDEEQGSRISWNMFIYM